MSIQEERAAIKAWWHDRIEVELRLIGHTIQAEGGIRLSEAGERCVRSQLERLIVDVAEVCHGEGYQQGRREWRLWHETKL